jgi:DNA-binding XRE family transcriptional regulator
VTRKTVNTVENGYSRPRPAAHQAGEALSVPVEELFWIED